MNRGIEIYRTLDILLRYGSIKTTMIIAPEEGSICSIFYNEKPYKVMVVGKELLPDKDGYEVTFKIVNNDEVKENQSK